MSYEKVSPGDNLPENLNVIIEIPAHGEPVKYEVDKASGALFVDRFMSTSMHYPCNYGYVPRTLCDDGDPLDVLVVAPHPLVVGSVITVRPIGMLKMTDESGMDSKILAVPSNKLTHQYHKVATFEDLPESLIKSIAHFFEHYKDLEEGKWVNIDGWFGLEETKQEIMDSVKNYKG